MIQISNRGISGKKFSYKYISERIEFSKNINWEQCFTIEILAHFEESAKFLIELFITRDRNSKAISLLGIFSTIS